MKFFCKSKLHCKHYQEIKLKTQKQLLFKLYHKASIRYYRYTDQRKFVEIEI